MSVKTSPRRQTARRRRQLATVLATTDPKSIDLGLTPATARPVVTR